MAYRRQQASDRLALKWAGGVAGASLLLAGGYALGATGTHGQASPAAAAPTVTATVTAEPRPRKTITATPRPRGTVTVTATATELRTRTVEPAPEEPRVDPGCDPNYAGACVPIVSYDLDCGDISGSVTVVGIDIHRFDGDGDGYGCE